MAVALAVVLDCLVRGEVDQEVVILLALVEMAVEEVVELLVQILVLVEFMVVGKRVAVVVAQFALFGEEIDLSHRLILVIYKWLT